MQWENSLMHLGVWGMGERVRKGAKERLRPKRQREERCQGCLSCFRTRLKSSVVPDLGKQGRIPFQPLQMCEKQHLPPLLQICRRLTVIKLSFILMLLVVGTMEKSNRLIQILSA